MKNIVKSAKGQAMPAYKTDVRPEAFEVCDGVEIRWLGGAGTMINAHGTVIFIDPVLEGFDMDLLFETPLTPEGVKKADAVIITHIDNDHFSIPTLKDIKSVCKEYHSTQYVASVMRENDIPGIGHDIWESFEVGGVKIQLTPALHNWQNDAGEEFAYREWKVEDYCGFYLTVGDKKIWMPGDSQLMEEQLHMEAPDVMLFDFSDNEYHIGFDNAVKLAETYPNSELVCIHWGTVDAPEFTPFNADPERLASALKNPDRVKALIPGEAYRA